MFMEDNLDIFLHSDEHYRILKMIDKIIVEKMSPDNAFHEALTGAGKAVIAGKLLVFVVQTFQLAFNNKKMIRMLLQVYLTMSQTMSRKNCRFI